MTDIKIDRQIDRKVGGALAALEAPEVAWGFFLRKVAPLLNGIQKSISLSLLLYIFEARRRLGCAGSGGRVAKWKRGTLTTPPGPYKLKLFREYSLNS